MLTTNHNRTPDLSRELDFILVALDAQPPRWWQLALRWRLRRIERRIPAYCPNGGAK